EPYTCYGRVNLAARLMTAAGWGNLGRMKKLPIEPAPFLEVNAKGLRTLKGFTEAQPVYQLIGRPTANLTVPFSQQTMVGREAELARLHAFVTPIFQGQFAGLLTLVGEAGLGKSRLAHEFAQQLLREQSSPPAIFLCQTDEIIRAALNPWRYWLRHYFSQVATDSDAENKDRFQVRLESLIRVTSDETLRQELGRTRSVLGALLDLRWPGSLYEQLEPKLRLENMFTALVTLLRGGKFAPADYHSTGRYAMV
ncbi:MAG: AAA family ATPase, partial [Chloroflexi bacterium]|nr:AAA family ATPase [Chloroflexota bacterium]